MKIKAWSIEHPISTSSTLAEKHTKFSGGFNECDVNVKATYTTKKYVVIGYNVIFVIIVVMITGYTDD